MKEKLLILLKERTEMTASQIAEQLGLSRQFVHRELKKLLEEGFLQKIGQAPRTYYKLSQNFQKALAPVGISADKIAFLNEHFLFISETGDRSIGLEAMAAWCARYKLPIEKTVEEFIKTRKKYLAYFNNDGLISGLQKIKDTKGFDEIGLDDICYQDFYAIERFGKTRLGNLLHFAKQGQNRQLMKEISTEIKPSLLHLIKSAKIDAVGFIPPTIKREVQIMHVLQKQLHLPLPEVKLIKVKGEIVVPQKALNRLEDRISNARNTIVVGESLHYKNVLLIDDAIGSGATMNETAIKLKKSKVASKVIGYAVTGSYKGFDVIQEI